MTATSRWLSIIPPYLLRHIVETGTAEERASAEVSLALTWSLREERAAATMAPTAAPIGTASVTVYDAGQSTTLPGQLARGDDDPPTGDPAVDEAHTGLHATLDLFDDVYGRNSLDDLGMDLVASVHYGRNYDNAAWTGSQMIFGDGDGSLFNRFTIAIDVMGHELTHGVTQFTAGLKYEDQSGALNESVSDVFGSLVKQYSATPRQTSEEADWVIGAGLFAPGVNGVGLRSMRAPGTAYDDPRLGQDPQPSSMTDYVQTSDDNGGVHINSGIPNRAFYLAATALGGYAWERAGHIWYATLTDGQLASDASFVAFAELTIAKAERLFGADAAEVVSNAWREVEVLAGDAAGAAPVGSDLA